MSRKRKANTTLEDNVTVEDIGTEYKGPEGHCYRLIARESEPMATMKDLDRLQDDIIKKPISEFADFVRLKPEREIPKLDKPRKERADKGRHHKVKPGKLDIESQPGSANKTILFNALGG